MYYCNYGQSFCFYTIGKCFKCSVTKGQDRSSDNPTDIDQIAIYSNTPQREENTTIAVDDLNNFMLCHNKQYFEEQFKVMFTLSVSKLSMYCALLECACCIPLI